MKSRIDLNKCFTNNDGNLEIGNDYYRTCSECRVFNTDFKIACGCRNKDLKTISTTINFNESITVGDSGIPECNGNAFDSEPTDFPITPENCKLDKSYQFYELKVKCLELTSELDLTKCYGSNYEGELVPGENFTDWCYTCDIDTKDSELKCNTCRKRDEYSGKLTGEKARFSKVNFNKSITVGENGIASCNGYSFNVSEN